MTHLYTLLYILIGMIVTVVAHQIDSKHDRVLVDSSPLLFVVLIMLWPMTLFLMVSGLILIVIGRALDKLLNLPD
jgi:hypothetical protein